MKIRRALLVLLISIFGLFTVPAGASPETDFWAWFQKNEAVLFDFEHDQEVIFDRLLTAMQEVHPRLVFEFGPKVDGRREFVISADGIIEAFPKVESLYATAPKLEKWIFIKFRPRREPFDVKVAGTHVRAETVRVKLEHDGEKTGITVFIPGYTEAEYNSYTAIAFLMLDQALGEYDVETRVGYVEVKAPPANLGEVVSLEDLPKEFDEFLSDP